MEYKRGSYEEYEHGQIPEADYDFDEDMEDPDARASGESKVDKIADDMAATMLRSCGIDAPFRKAFAQMKLAEVEQMFLEEPGDYRSATILQWLCKGGSKSFEEIHLYACGDWNAGCRGSSDARASGEQSKSKLVHNQHARKNQQASTPSPTPPARWVTWE